MAAKAECVYLATDPDREGESISWHLLEQVVGKKPHYRITYTQITETAVQKAVANARALDMSLVSAQRARQCLDKLVGFKLSKLIQRANAGKSAGRVQSAALHILCERERQIQKFKPVPYWTLQTEYGEGFRAMFMGEELQADVEQVETVDDAADGQAETTDSKRITSEADANRIVEIAKKHPHQVVEFSGKQASKNPPPPLTTSAMQQAAGVRYGFDSDTTMQLAQELFEGVNLPNGDRHGIITYHRTDSVDLSPEFCEEARHWLSQEFPDLVPSKTAKHKNKAGAQGAHEAVRPVEVALTPERMKPHLSQPQLKLYTLVWQRAVASQCAPAQFDRTRVVIQAGSTYWVARGSILTFAGYTKILGELGGDTELPTVKEGDRLKVQKVWHEAKKTTPLGRYTEPRLVQTLEKLGIGRPSTFANIIKVLKDREYVKLQNKAMVPTVAGLQVDECLAKVFPSVLNSKFTATMEGSLDAIAEGKQDWEKYLIKFHFDFFLPALEKQGAALLSEVEQSYKKSEVCCPQCQESLIEMPYRKAQTFSSKPFYLKCSKCSDVVMFWSDKGQAWRQKGEQTESQPKPPGKRTKWVCQACGQPLEEYSYQKEGQDKLMLRCSGGCYKKPETKDIAVYFQTAKGFWNFALQAEPLTEKVAGGGKATKSTAKKAKKQ